VTLPDTPLLASEKPPSAANSIVRRAISSISAASQTHKKKLVDELTVEAMADSLRCVKDAEEKCLELTHLEEEGGREQTVFIRKGVEEDD